MTLHHVRTLTLAILVCAFWLAPVPGHAQHSEAQAWIRITSNGFTSVMYFGYDSRATYGIDPALGEMEGPPLSPAFDVRWANPPRHLEPSYGMGLLFNDFIPCPTNSERKDTFDLLVSDGMTASKEWLVSWPSPDTLRRLADSMFIFCPGLGVRPINMFRQSSWSIPYPESPHRLRIFVYGGCRCLIAGSEAGKRPLHSNDNRTIGYEMPDSFRQKNADVRSMR